MGLVRIEIVHVNQRVSDRPGPAPTGLLGVQSRGAIKGVHASCTDRRRPGAATPGSRKPRADVVVGATRAPRHVNNNNAACGGWGVDREGGMTGCRCRGDRITLRRAIVAGEGGVYWR